MEGKIQTENSKTTENETENNKKEIYFIIFYLRNQRENSNDFVFSNENNNLPTIIFNKEIKISDNRFTYRKVFKIKNVWGKKNAEIIFFIGQEDKYIINLEIQEKTFIYDVNLKIGHKIWKYIPFTDINQQKMEYQDKFDIFLEALKQNKEEYKMGELYQETIKLYLNKSMFSLIISLFTKIYQDKNLCKLLIQKFCEMNLNFKDNEKNYINSGDDEKLKKFNSLMINISSESGKLVKTNDYDPIQFYGIIFSYLNYYDYNNFEIYFNRLYKEKCEILYEILIVYFSYFVKPIKENKKDKDFFVNFIEYIIFNKDFSYLNIGLSFIIDMEILIFVIDKTKEKIYNKYIKENNDKANFILIELEHNRIFKEETILGLSDVVEEISSINSFSKEKKYILVFFKSEFWESVLGEFKKINPSPKYFEVCYKLRKTFMEYDEFIQTISDQKNNKDIILDLKNYHEYDEFAIVLNEKIENYFELNKGKLQNFEILGYIQQYNPYYQDEVYKHKRESNILDFLNFDCDYNDEFAMIEHQRFIETFKSLQYEDIFGDNLVKFLDTMTNKIKSISSLETVMNLIRVDKIKDKKKEYIEKLKNKFKQKIKPEIEKLNDDNISKPVEIITEFTKLIFDNENNCDFLENNINDLKICPLIYNQLIRICKEDKYKIIKEFIYKKFLNNIKNINNIIELIDSLKSEDKEKFLKELIKKCEFTKEEFYSTEENNKIELLLALYENKKITKISGNIKETLIDIINDLDKLEIEKKNLEKFLRNPEEVVKKRLGLIKINFEGFGIENILDRLKTILNDINIDIKVLTDIKKILSISQRERYQKEIIEMIEILKKLKNIKIKEYNSDSFIQPISKFKDNFETLAKEVSLVQDFLLFKVIYENTKGNNQEIQFKRAKEKLEEIKKSLTDKKKPDIDEIYKNNKENFDIIRKKLINNEERSKKFFKNFIEYFKIDENKELVEDITLLFNSKKYEMDLKSEIILKEIKQN